MPLSDLQSVASGAFWVPLADAIAKATLLLATAGLVSFVLRRGSAAARHLVWTLALLSALALPALSIALPRWQLPIVTLTAPATTVSAPATEMSMRRPPAVRARRVADQTEPAPPTAAPTADAGAAPAGVFSIPQVSWPAVLLLVWAMGAGAMLGRLGLGLLAVQWMSRRTERVTDAPWLPLARALATELGISPRIVFLRSGRAAMPMAWGILRPSVLMPADADAWPAERLRIVLLHELAHVKRRDCLTHVLAQVSCALYWFNPLAWIAARHVRTEGERACDDLVLAAGTRGADYADQLIEVARLMRSGRFPALVAGVSLAMAHRSQLEGRLMAILDPTVPRSGISRVRTAVATTMFACAVMPLASLQPWAIASERSAVDLSTLSSTPDARTDLTSAQQPTPTPAPTPAAFSKATAEAAAQAASTAVQSAVQTNVQSAVQSAVQTNVQDGVQGAVQGALQGALQGSIQGAVQSALSAADINRDSTDDDQDAKGKPADPRMVAALTAALKDTDKDVRETALHALVQLRDPSIFGPLVQALSDTAADVREQAAFGLGQLRDRRAVEPLVAALKDQNADVREQAAFALGQLRDRSAVPGLTAALKDADDDVREQAVFALGQLRDPAAVEALISAARDAKPHVREQAVFALGQIRDRRAVETLISALKDANADVRQQAAFALGQIR